MRRMRIFLELPILLATITCISTFVIHSFPLVIHKSSKIERPDDESQPVELVARSAFATFCQGCHQSGRSGLDLGPDTLNLEEMRHHPSVWADVARRMREQEMPPRKFPQPTRFQRASMVEWIEKEVLQKPAQRTPPRLFARRLQRVEYLNAVRDLLGGGSAVLLSLANRARP